MNRLVIGSVDLAHLELDCKNQSTIWCYKLRRKLLQIALGWLITNRDKILSSKKIKTEHLSGSIVQNIIQFIYVLCQVVDYRNKVKLSCRLLGFIQHKAFLKNKKRSETSLLPHLRHNFCLLLYSVNWPYFIVWLVLLREILSNMFISIVF